jgi:flagellin
VIRKRDDARSKHQEKALGVLNNLSAIYAENNLNNTNASLQTVLQQLFSGSMINSGADDAAGLSLVNGLAANTRALTQSATNATEGVGLLQVADGAFSQETNLLDRAITLATEASNGTLNSSQSAAANQEYQSILSEINNIGSTTTYNQNQVFNGSLNGVAIYTGDSSANGSSIDSLYFANLSAASMGDTGGAIMQNRTAQFLDLTKDTAGVVTTLGATGDTVTPGLAFTITGPTGTPTTYTSTSVTAAALIAEINAKDIPGVTASWTTASAVGVNGVAAADAGIQITNTNPNVSIALGAGPFTDTTSGAQALKANTAATTTISYQFAASGDTSANLKNTDLNSQINAQTALAALNLAITDVASQDGYIGAQINTLNSISQVMATQQENVTAAQNALQATDYASATSNMSKYEILSQTGIAALAQANSVEQEVTKLLQ